MALVSVVIPAFKCEPYLRFCLDSVLSQTVTDLEVLVVDDCSPDRSAEIVSEYMKQDPRIRLIRQPENRGVAAARNTGVAAASGTYVAFLDSDDAWRPDKLARQLAKIEQAGAAFSFTAAACIDPAGNALPNVFEVPTETDYDRLLKGNVIVTSSVLARRDLLARHPMVKGDFHEDFVCWLQILQDCGRAVGSTERLTLYRFTPGSLSRNKLHSAKKTWNVYKYMRVPVTRRLSAFAGYVIHGIRRYLR